MGQKYLVPYENDSVKATGIIYGPFARPMICLPVVPLGKKADTLSIHFLVDTGSPATYLSKEALKALYRVEDFALIQSTNMSNMNIWGTKVPVGTSVAHW